MSLINFTNLDFDQIKLTLKDYLQSNSDFTDYDFEGSNLSTILDVLSYNTYITSYNANMISNEVFIDSATLRENVVALARNIGYVPRSKKSSRSFINFFVDVSSVSPAPPNLTLKAGPVASTSGSFNGQSFVFSIPEDITVSVIDGIASFEDIEVFEGSYLSQIYVYSSRNPFQKFIMPNSGIDLDSLVVTVSPSTNSSVTTVYNRHDNLFDNNTGITINGNSNVYFIQEVESERYEVIFGDGIFGKKLEDGNVVEMTYITTSGSDANGVNDFVFSGSVSYVRNSVEIFVTSGISLITSLNSSSGGESIESIDSIRKYAPQMYATQNRALSANDYEVLIPNKIYPEAESISVFGGEDLVPPQYGKVFITIKPRNGDFVPNIIKNNIKRDLKKYSVAGIVPEILDLKYLFIETNSKVYYNTNLAPNAAFVSTKVQRDLTTYAESSQLNKYGARFKYSKLLKVIDQSHESITSNITTIEMRRDLRLATSEVAEYAIDFGNRFHIKSMGGYNIRTSAFRVVNISSDVFLFDTPQQDGKRGQIGLFSLPEGSSTPIIQRRNIGIVNYETGRITLDPINIVSGKTKDNVQIMEISVSPESNDIVGLQDLYLQLDKSVVDMVVDQISSGIDPSGSTYTVTTSYKNGSIIR
tara:strand:+ start:499 stop:2430 length:1932 start_codon:yes stop_codon:yes gene_type:complete